MSNKEKPLPKPPTKAFGRKNNFEQQEDQAALLADRMAQAAAEGKLDEFLKKEMPDNEYARNLASMMMGMTGVMPGVGSGINPPEAETGEQQQPSEEEKRAEEPTEVPDDVRQAILGGDLESLMGLLRREHQKRNPGASVQKEGEQASPSPGQNTSSPGQPSIDKEIIDALVRIAAENSVTLDWIILRAIKVYVQEYQKTGKL
ncbi:MAG: hypothetical protein A2010_15630 [Nitrospirae bacterium GWD2_57_9]|nr:MAG: hypothetical protein A2010_15630 [Nitrospirae bacterium GWD2_57_9]